MSAHWWELWSPGLQAMGGIVELIGAAFLALEWRGGLKEKRMSILSIVHKRLKADRELAAPEPAGLLTPLIREREAAEEEYKKAGQSFYITEHHFRLYIRGFVLIVLGVIIQVGANGIAWAGAYGLFS